MNASQYVAQVELHLRDLPWRARKNLVAELHDHLAEFPADEDLVARLGSPQTYAGELRAAAGLAPRRGPLAFIRARRPRNVTIAVVLVVIVAAITAAVTWARAYQPLSTGSTSLSPNPSRQGPAGEMVAVFRQSRPFQYGTSIRNSGRFPVRILAIPSDPAFINPFQVRPYVVPSETNFAERPVPFHPFTLDPGHERLIVLRGVYTHCRQFSPGSGEVLTAIRVRTRFTLWTHTVSVQMPNPLIIRVPVHPCRGR